MAFGDLWSNRKYPDGCRSCGQTQGRHVGHGLCQRCYRDPEIIAAVKNGELSEIMGNETTVETDVDIVSGVSETTDEVSDDRLGERRPGSFQSPVTATVEDPPGVGFRNPFKKKFKGSKPTPPPFTTKEKAPKGVGRRQSAAGSIEDIWTGISGLAGRTGHAPLGRYLQWQAPAAGEMLDQAIAGTPLDKKLFQPAIRARGRLDMVISVIGPPGIILAIERNPERAPMLIPILKSAIRSSLPTMLPAMKKAQAREEKITASLAEMFPDMPPGVDPVDLVIEQLFAGYVFQSPEPTMEYTPDENETNGQTANRN